MEARLRQEQRKNSTLSELADGSQAQSQAAQRPGISRFGSFIGGRKPEAAQQNGKIQPAGTREKDLEEKLVKEQTARIAAEKKARDVGTEMEDLSATLFQQANEMVAAEKKENAALQDKIQELSRQQDGVKNSEGLEKENTKLKEKLKALEQRDADRKKRFGTARGCEQTY